MNRKTNECFIARFQKLSSCRTNMRMKIYQKLKKPQSNIINIHSETEMNEYECDLQLKISVTSVPAEILVRLVSL